MHAVGCTRPTWRWKEANRGGDKDGGKEWWMQNALSHNIPRGSQPPTLDFCGFSERVLKDNPMFSLTAPTPLLILRLEQKKIWIFSTQHAGISFLNPYYPWWKSLRPWIRQRSITKCKIAPRGRLKVQLPKHIQIQIQFQEFLYKNK